MALHTRRTLLASTATMAGLAGCAALAGSETLSQIELNSDSDEDHTVSVEVLNIDGEVLFDQSFELASEMMNEGIEPFSGEPDEIIVQIDDAEPLRSEWPEYPTRLRANETPRTFTGEGCGTIEGESVTGVFVIVIDQTHVGLEPTCATPR